MGSHVRRRPSGEGRRGREGERESDDERKRDRRKISRRDRVIQNKINDLFYSEKFEAASELLVKKSFTEISNNEHLTFLLAAIDVIKRTRVERIIDKDEFVSNSLNKAIDFTGYKFDKEDKDIVANIIKNKVVDIGGDT